jgi:hypothetical protein
MKYYLIDANIASGYYLRRSAKDEKSADRIEMIIDFIRENRNDYFIYIPNFCVAETVNVFIKHSFGAWNRHVKKKGAIDTRVYQSVIKAFQEDIHNAKFLYHYELDRYHILGINLVAPIDHYYKINRTKNRKRNDPTPSGTFDHLIISMGIQLTKIHGSGSVKILTTDYRLAKVVEKCRSNIRKTTLEKLKMKIAESVTSTDFSKDIFPECIDLSNCSNKELEKEFGMWPLTIKGNNVYKYKE